MAWRRHLYFCREIFEMLTHAALSESFKAKWIKPDESSDGKGVFSVPFKHLILPDFVSDQQFLQNLKNDLLGLEFNEKNNDLYKFRQSSDLKSIKSGNISSFKDLLYNDFRKWLVDTTGIPLDETVDVSCAQYTSTDILLCHDDELEGRRIAFIFYLVDEDWSEVDGGTLDLFSSDANGEPDRVVKKIVPKWNNLVLFEVTPFSHHQVAEVLSDKVRLSISGWFYGKSLERPPLQPEAPRISEKPKVTEQEDDYFDWISPSYMNPEAQGDIQQHFEEHSEIQLQDFLAEDIHKSLLDSLYSPDKPTSWQHIGPPHKRSYEIPQSSTDMMERARDFFSSELMLLLLSNMTGLKLHPLAPDSSDDESEEEQENGEGSSKRKKERSGKASKKARLSPEPNSTEKSGEASESAPDVFVEWRKFQHGAYTLLHDAATSESKHSLMLIYYVTDEEWDSEFGGFSSFVAKGENEELLTVFPKSNCLALVYCCPATLSFVKYINNKSGNRRYFSLNGFYTQIGGHSDSDKEEHSENDQESGSSSEE